MRFRRTQQRTALYRFYGEGSALLYVGITNNVSRRWEQHAADKPWWPEVKGKTVEWYGSRPKALKHEERAIIHERPKYNIQHNEANPDRVVYRKLDVAPWKPRRKVYRVSRWQPFFPLIPLAVLGALFWRADEAVRIELGIGVLAVVGFLVCMALFWRPMWRNIRELWR